VLQTPSPRSLAASRSLGAVLLLQAGRLARNLTGYIHRENPSEASISEMTGVPVSGDMALLQVLATNRERKKACVC
jgi:hypothetical protein